MTPGGVAAGLHRAQQLDAQLADLVAQVGRVVAADRVVVGDRAARGDDRPRRRVLGRAATARPGRRPGAPSTVKYSEAPLGYRCEMWQPTWKPGSAPRTAAVRAAPGCSRTSRSRASRRRTPRSIRSSRRCGPAKRDFAHACPGEGPSGNAPPRTSRRAAAARPCAPCQPHTSRQRPSSSRRPSAPAAASATFSCVSCSSDSRAMSGASPSCSSARSSSAPSMNDADRPAVVGRLDPPPHAHRELRDHAQRPLGAEHELPQRRPRRRARARPSVASDPDGVTHSSATTCLSKRPCPVEVCPAERVAAHPPTVAHSYDCGTWPELQPLRAQRRVRLGQPDARLEDRDPRPRIDRRRRGRAARGPATPAPRTARAPPRARRRRSSRRRTAPRPRPPRHTPAAPPPRRRRRPARRPRPAPTRNRPPAAPAGPGTTSRGSAAPAPAGRRAPRRTPRALAQPGRQPRTGTAHVLQRHRRRDDLAATRRAPPAAARRRARGATGPLRARPSPRRPARASLAS